LEVRKMKKKIIFITAIFLSVMLLFGVMGYLGVFLEKKKLGAERGKIQPLPGEEKVEGDISQQGSLSKNSSTGDVSLEPVETRERASSLQERLIIFNRTVTLEVEDVKKSAWVIEKLAGEYGGYIQSLSFGRPTPYFTERDSGKKRGEDKVKEGTIVVRIPAEKFKSFSQEIRSLGKLVEDMETAEEVTDRYIDLSARLRNLKKEEQRLLEIFKSARNVEEMLLVEREIQRIRGEIESLTAQKANLEKSARFAVFTIYLRTPEAIVSPPDSSWGFGEALRRAVRNFVAVVNGIIVVTGALLPLVIIGLIFHFGYKLRNFLSRRKEEGKAVA
jgi:flagellar basal body-associated protein FliL